MRKKDFIEASHTRCENYQIGKDRVISHRIIEGQALDQVFKDNHQLMTIAKPFIDEIYNFVRGTDFFVILTDRNGCILSITGDQAIISKARKLQMIPGAYMDEKSIGTNAMGTSIYENRPLQISGEEHFVKAYHTWTCSGAPIHDSFGNIIGALDMTGNSQFVHSHTLGMVVSAVKAIELNLNLNTTNLKLKQNNDLIESLINAIQDGIIQVDLNGQILSSNDQASKMFGYSNDQLLELNIKALVNDWDQILIHTLSEHDFYNEDVMIHSRRNKLHYNLSVYKVRTNNGITGLILMFRDVKKVRKLANHIMGRKAIYTFDKIIGQSKEMVEVIAFAKKIADSQSTILITGESGCGKEVFAQAIQNHSPKRDEAFVVINCGAIPRNLIESELFGYEEGAFTGAKRGGQVGKFEVADGGTIFLDEIGEMPLEMQTKLLRVIEEGTIVKVGGNTPIPVSVRIIAATNKPLKDEVSKGNFRHDLYYRLNVIPIELPPLRKRADDIPRLTDYFMEKISNRINKKPVKIMEADMDIIRSYRWPGNVRELENFIELAINKEKLPLDILEDDFIAKERICHFKASQSLADMEAAHIQNVLPQEANNITNTAKILGIGRNTLYRKLEKHRIEFE